MQFPPKLKLDLPDLPSFEDVMSQVQLPSDNESPTQRLGLSPEALGFKDGFDPFLQELQLASRDVFRAVVIPGHEAQILRDLKALFTPPKLWEILDLEEEYERKALVAEVLWAFKPVTPWWGDGDILQAYNNLRKVLRGPFWAAIDAVVEVLQSHAPEERGEDIRLLVTTAIFSAHDSLERSMGLALSGHLESAGRVLAMLPGTIRGATSYLLAASAAAK